MLPLAFIGGLGIGEILVIIAVLVGVVLLVALLLRAVSPRRPPPRE